MTDPRLPPLFPLPGAEAWGEDEFGLWLTLAWSGVAQRFRWLPPGRFLMGSPPGEAGRHGNETPHWVTLSRGFWLGDTAVTQGLWRAVMGANPSRFKGERRPVEQVSWEEAQDFIGRLNEAQPGLAARLPSEAEWEYACRAGTTTPFAFGATITPAQVNYHGRYPYAGGEPGAYRGETVAVASLPANAWGLYEMHGNVWEWCQDVYTELGPGAALDPRVGAGGAGVGRVVRGGSWSGSGRGVRSAVRSRPPAGERNDFLGLRLALGRVEPGGPGEPAGAGRADARPGAAGAGGPAAPERRADTA